MCGKNEAAVNGDFSCVHVGCSAKPQRELSQEDLGFLNEVQTIAEAFGASELLPFISNIRTGKQEWGERGDNRNGKGRCTEARTPEAEAAAAVLLTAPGALAVLAASNSAAAAGPLAEGEDGDPENPCPICLVNGDDHGGYGHAVL